MTTLVPFNNNEGLEIVIDTNNGETFASISAVARMTDKPSKTIHKYVNGGLKGVTQMTLKTAEIQTPGGLQGVTLLNEDQMLEVICKYNPELLMKFAQVTLRMYLHQEAGYKHGQRSVGLTQQLLDEIYALICIKCDDEANPDVIIILVVEYLRELNPKDESTLRMSMMSVIDRLERVPDHKLNEKHCRNMAVKRLRHIQKNLEGASSIARHLFPKVEQADPENCDIINPSSVQHLLTDVTQFKSDEQTPIKNPNVNALMIPSRKGYIKQYIPVLAPGYALDVPGIHIDGVLIEEWAGQKLK
jgi:hypothetical protein